MMILKVAIFTLLLLSGGVDGTPVPKLNPCDDTGVLIVGAGWSGCAAASELQRYNNANYPGEKIDFRVVEAANFVGGRGVAVHWIVGAPDNPIAKLMQKYVTNWASEKVNQRWDDIVFFQKGSQEVNQSESEPVKQRFTNGDVSQLISMLSRFAAIQKH
jgi:monoamine oxidase